MKPIIMLACLFMALSCVMACDDDDDNDENGKNDESEDDDNTDDDNDNNDDDNNNTDDDDNDDNDNQNGESYRPYGEDLPPCDPYVEDYAWFEIENFAVKVENFFARYGTNVQSCMASVDGNDLEIACADWSLSLRWFKETDLLPVKDGRQVKVTASIGLDDYGDVMSWAIGILDEEMEVLIFQADGMAGYWPADAFLHTTDTAEVVCEYYAGQAQPPSSPEDPFTQVVGLSLDGSLNDIEFSISAPEREAPTEDGEYWAILPIHYLGVFDWTDECYDDCDVYEIFFQLVKK